MHMYIYIYIGTYLNRHYCGCVSNFRGFSAIITDSPSVRSPRHFARSQSPGHQEGETLDDGFPHG